MPFLSVLSLFLIFLILILKFKERIFKIQLNPTGYILGFYIFLFSWSFFGLLYMGEGPNVKRLLGFILIIIAVLFSEKFIVNISKFKLIKNYLTIHLSFFYVQLFAHYLFDIQIDYLFFITGEEQRTLNDHLSFDLTGAFMRPSGLYVEPGTYAAFIAPFLALFSKWYQNSKSNRFILWVGILSLFLSGSTFGMIFGAIIFFTFKGARIIYKMLIIAPAVFYIFPYFYYRFFIREHGNGLGIREQYITNFIDYSLNSIDGLIFGVKNMLSLIPKIPYGSVSENDLGVLTYLLFSNGMVIGFIIILFFTFVLIKLQYTSKVAFLIVLLSKQSMFSPFFPFMLMLIMHRSFKKRKLKLFSLKVDLNKYIWNGLFL